VAFRSLVVRRMQVGKQPVAHGLLVALVALSALSANAAPILELDTDERDVALVELFTSEGCSSCPPADQFLSDLQTDARLWRDYVPVAWHVDYWDYIGWQDVWAEPEHALRQRQYKRDGVSRSVYTPQFIVAGEEWRGFFRSRQLPTPKPSAGRLKLVIEDGQFEAAFYPREPDGEALELHVALLVTDRSSEISRGENRGRTLHHDFVIIQHAVHGADQSGDAARWRGGVPSLSDADAVAAWVTVEDQQVPLQAVGGAL